MGMKVGVRVLGLEIAWTRLQSLIHLQTSDVVAFEEPLGLGSTTLRSSECAMAEAFETLMKPVLVIAFDRY
jgi:hypothetical protein